MSPSRRSAPDMSRFCPTLGWLHLVKNVSHRATVDVTLPEPIVVNVPDMWNRDEDKKLLQTIVKTIPLNDYNPTIVLLCVSRDTSDIASEKKTTPSLSPRSSFVHRCICYRNPTCHSMTTFGRLMYLSVYDNRYIAFEPSPSPTPGSSFTYVLFKYIRQPR